jgi:hypothetical protein
MTRSSPALAAGSVDRAAYQSDMTTPSKPHSSLRTSASSGCSVAVVPVDRVVGGHHRPHAGLADDRLERGQVALAQRLLVDLRVQGPAVGLRIVGDEVLDGGRDPAGLQPAHVGGPDPGRQQRVLAEALEMAAAVGRAVQVHGRGEQHVDPLAALAAHPGRAVGHHQPAQPDRRLGRQRPEVGPGEQPDLPLERQRRQPFAQDRFHRYLLNPAVSPLRSWRRPIA